MKIVPESQRLNFLPWLFGNKFIKGEQLVYYWASRLCAEYEGGFWSFYKTANGSGFLALPESDLFKIENDMNGACEKVNGIDFGIIVTIFALSSLFEINENCDDLIIKCDALKDFAYDRKESSKIIHVLD